MRILISLYSLISIYYYTLLIAGYNDYMASKDNLLVIKAFFKKFPERKHQPFIIAGESYGGYIDLFYHFIIIDI